MSEEHDSWFKQAFGVDLGESVSKIEAQAVGAVERAAGTVTGSFPLSGSVGRGGKNPPNDVRAVQAALGIAADGKCGPQTVAAIETFQKTIGQAKPDGRVDAGGATERALTTGSKSTSASPPAREAEPGPDSEPTAEPGVDKEFRKTLEAAAASFAPVIDIPGLGKFDMAATLDQAANQVVERNAVEGHLLERAELLLGQSASAFGASSTPSRSLALSEPTVRFSGTCCSSEELQKFREALQGPRTSLANAGNALDDAKRALVEAAQQGERACYLALGLCLLGSATKFGPAGAAACAAAAVGCIAAASPVQNAIRVETKAKVDHQIAMEALERALANYFHCHANRCDR